MKIETRKVMIEQDVYIAEDGTEFEDQDDCEAYETRLIGKRLKMYTHSHIRTDRTEHCWYAKLDTQEEANDFITLCKFEGITALGVQGPGVYMYTEGTYGNGKDAWTNLSVLVDIINGGTADAC